MKKIFYFFEICFWIILTLLFYKYLLCQIRPKLFFDIIKYFLLKNDSNYKKIENEYKCNIDRNGDHCHYYLFRANVNCKNGNFWDRLLE